MTFTIETLNAQRGAEVKALYSALAETDEYKKIKELGDNPDEIIAAHILSAFNSHPSNEPFRFAMMKKKLVRGVEIAMNRDNRGILLGTVDDRWDNNTKIPETFLLLQSDGTFKKISSFRHNVYSGPGIYTMSWKLNEGYNNYTLDKIFGKTLIQKNPCNILKAIAKDVDDEYWTNLVNLEEKPIVVLHGKVSDVHGVTIFENKQPVGEYPLRTQNLKTPMPDECPTMRLRIRSNNQDPTIYFNVNFGVTTNGCPFFGLPDFDTTLDTLVESTKTLDEQTMELKDYFEYIGDVYVVGYVTKRKDVTSQYTKETNPNFEIRACAILSESYTGFEDGTANGSTTSSSDNIVANSPKYVDVEAKGKEDLREMALGKKSTTTPAVKVDSEVTIEDAPTKKPAKVSEEPKLFNYADDTVTDTASETVEASIAAADQKKKTSKKSSSKKISYSDDPNEFVNVTIEQSVEKCRMLHKEKEYVTIEYLKGISGMSNSDEVPMAIWKVIATGVKTRL